MKPEVTVLIITYNHSSYIAKCIESVLSQKTDFDYEILIHDDASTDGTTEIIKRYINKHEGKIRLIQQKVNKYSMGINRIINEYITPHIRGRYVTYTDGDDYWCDDNKLQKQFNYMESHQECSLCISNVFAVNKNGERIKDCYPNKSGIINKKYIFDYPRGSFIASSSTFFRKECFIDFPNWRLEYPVDDAPAFMQACFYGYIYKFKERMSCYRRFSDGSWSESMLDLQKRLKLIEEIQSALSHLKTNDPIILSMLDNKTRRLNFEYAFLQNNYEVIFNKSNRKFLREKDFRTRMSLFLRYKMPKTYSLLRKKQ